MRNPAMPAAMRVLDAINTGDLSCLPDCVAADFVDHGSPLPIPPGPEGYAQILGFVTQVLNIHDTLDEAIETDDRIILRATPAGVGVAAVHGAPAEGKNCTMSTVHIYRTEGDRLAEHLGVRDEVSVMRQLGLLPAADGPSEVEGLP